MVEKVTDPSKKVDNAHLRKVLTAQGMDANYVELIQDYAPRRVDGKKVKGRSPYAHFYKDRKSGRRVMEVGILPHCDTLGRKIDCRWTHSGGKYYSGINLFSAVVEGRQIRVTCLSDQPHGAKKDDWVEWNPQIYLDGVEQSCGEATLFATDPMNAGYHDNTIEWDYGICKRRIRIIEGRIREKWLFISNPNSEVKIKHNHTGTYGLRLLTCKINDDEELVPTLVFDEAEYPFEVMASPETFYPDPNIENTSVDGWASHTEVGQTWHTIVAGAGTSFNDINANHWYWYAFSHSTTNKWSQIIRGIFLFDTDGLPNDATITGVTLSLWGTDKLDDTSCVPDINIYSSDPNSNIGLANGDYATLGTEALATPIAYAAWNAAGYNVFTLIDVNSDAFLTYNVADTYINRTGISKFGARNANYDVADELDPNNHDPAWVSTKELIFKGYFADQGNTTNDPKLIVTYGAEAVPVGGSPANLLIAQGML